MRAFPLTFHGMIHLGRGRNEAAECRCMCVCVFVQINPREQKRQFDVETSVKLCPWVRSRRVQVSELELGRTIHESQSLPDFTPTHPSPRIPYPLALSFFYCSLRITQDNPASLKVFPTTQCSSVWSIFVQPLEGSDRKILHLLSHRWSHMGTDLHGARYNAVYNPAAPDALASPRVKEKKEKEKRGIME